MKILPKIYEPLEDINKLISRYADVKHCYERNKISDAEFTGLCEFMVNSKNEYLNIIQNDDAAAFQNFLAQMPIARFFLRHVAVIFNKVRLVKLLLNDNSSFQDVSFREEYTKSITRSLNARSFESFRILINNKNYTEDIYWNPSLYRSWSVDLPLEFQYTFARFDTRFFFHYNSISMGEYDLYYIGFQYWMLDNLTDFSSQDKMLAILHCNDLEEHQNKIFLIFWKFAQTSLKSCGLRCLTDICDRPPTLEEDERFKLPETVKLELWCCMYELPTEVGNIIFDMMTKLRNPRYIASTVTPQEIENATFEGMDLIMEMLKPKNETLSRSTLECIARLNKVNHYYQQSATPSLAIST